MRYLTFLLLFVACTAKQPADIAFKRAAAMKDGVNLSWLEHYWDVSEKDGSYEKYLNTPEIMAKKKEIVLMKKLGFKTVRLPICFHIWSDTVAPYKFNKESYFAVIDSVIKWTSELDMIVIIDYHHGNLFDKNFEKELPRVISHWETIAKKYADTDPEKVYFEMYNEPHDINVKNWQKAADTLVQVMRKEAPYHTIIANGTYWGGTAGLYAFKPLKDNNIIYSFHFYDPMLFTHQGASWTTDYVNLRGIPYPYDSTKMPKLPDVCKGKPVQKEFAEYKVNGMPAKMEQLIDYAAEWGKKNNLPLFCGEWGAFKPFSDEQSLCNYFNVCINAMKKRNISYAYFEFDGGFSFFKGEPSDSSIYPCMRESIKNITRK